MTYILLDIARTFAGMKATETARDLTYLQFELECIGLDENGLLTRIPGDNPDDIARFFIASYPTGYETFFRADIDSDIIQQLQLVSAERLFNDSDMVKAVLYQSLLPQEPSRFVSYVFTRRPLPVEFPDVSQQEEDFVILNKGRIISRAWASRHNVRAAELAVETSPDFRRRGYARQVCLAWAAYYLGHSRVAFYSHLNSNNASRALAQNLGLVPFLGGVGYP